MKFQSLENWLNEEAIQSYDFASPVMEYLDSLKKLIISTLTGKTIEAMVSIDPYKSPVRKIIRDIQEVNNIFFLIGSVNQSSMDVIDGSGKKIEVYQLFQTDLINPEDNYDQTIYIIKESVSEEMRFERGKDIKSTLKIGGVNFAKMISDYFEKKEKEIKSILEGKTVKARFKEFYRDKWHIKEGIVKIHHLDLHLTVSRDKKEFNLNCDQALVINSFDRPPNDDSLKGFPIIQCPGDKIYVL
jgi:hypothetical protein